MNVYSLFHERTANAGTFLLSPELQEISSYPGLDATQNLPAIEMVRAAAGGTETCKVAFGTEAGFFAQLGLPTLVIGPGDMEQDGHKPDEGLDLEELRKCDAMLARLVGTVLT